MNSFLPTTEQYVIELYKAVEGDMGKAVSMFDVGATLGLDKQQAGKLAEEVIAEGWAEIKSLSGGINITSEGIQAAGQQSFGAANQTGRSLGPGPVVDDADKDIIEQGLEWVRKCVPDLSLELSVMGELVIDIKTIQVQLLSPKPKTAVIKEALRSLHQVLESAGEKNTAARIVAMIS